MNTPSTSSANAAINHGIPERTVAEIQSCLREQFPQLHWLKLYGSRAMGKHWTSLRHPGLREHIERVGQEFPTWADHHSR